MDANDLRALADALRPMAKAPCFDGIDIERAADYLRAQADAQPVAMLASHRRLIEQAIQSAEHPSGMSTHDGKARIDASVLRRMLAIIDSSPAVPQAEPCIGNDPTCPCQDGDACHYRDAADGTKGWPVPQAEPKREPACLWSRADDDTDVWETGCGHAFTIIDGTPGDNQMEFCCYCGRPLEQEIGGSDAK